MPAPAAKTNAAVHLIWGEDEFAVKEQARQRFGTWCEQGEGIDQETIDAQAGNADEALKALARLHEALNTLPFFGGTKVVWFKNCNFLGDDRTASSQAVTAALGDLVELLKGFSWDNVQLLISAGKVDKRRTFYKLLTKIGTVEAHSGWSTNDRDWAEKAEAWAMQAIAKEGKRIRDDALGELIVRVGGQTRQLAAEIEKLMLYVGDRDTVTLDDVRAICLHSKQARAFALGDALGARHLPTLLRRLDEELWEVKLDPKRSEVGLLYGVISKIRSMLLLKEMVKQKWVRPGVSFPAFKAQLDGIPADRLPEDRRYSPLGINPYVLYKALEHAARYTTEELIHAMELLLQCNRRLVGSGLSPAMVLQQTLIEIVGTTSKPSAGRRPR